MKVLQLGSNRTQVHKDSAEHGEMTILYSYTTPVAVKILSTQEVYRTSAWFSKTTTRHINKWLEFTPESQINEMSQPNIEAMIQS
jgi:hypothetical protein